MPEEGGNPPDKTLKCGSTEASLWRRDGDFGPMYSVKFSRVYSEAGEQRRTSYLGGSDLDDLARLIPEAKEYISEQKREYRASHPQEGESPQEG